MVEVECMVAVGHMVVLEYTAVGLDMAAVALTEVAILLITPAVTGILAVTSRREALHFVEEGATEADGDVVDLRPVVEV
jgi:hypothetical protein